MTSAPADSSAADRRPAILFDVDGTLVDTNYFQAVAWFRAFKQEGHLVAMVDVQRHIGQGGERMIDSLLPDRDTSRDDVLTSAHSEYYSEFFGLMQPFASAQDLLRDLDARGAKVVLASSASSKELAALRNALDVEDALATVTSSADAGSSKPDPDILEAAMSQAGVGAESSIMIGDTVWDMEAAGKAGVPAIGVLTGGITAEALKEAGAIAIYDDVQALHKDLENSPIGKLLQTGRH